MTIQTGDMRTPVRHPAKYSDALLPVLAAALDGYERILDPFAGTGKLRSVRPDAYLLEIEPEWAAINGAQVGNALAMPWPSSYFDAVCTSPTYGNRMADHHEAKDASRRNTYRHALGRPLDSQNSGQLQWGKEYRRFHFLAWAEVRRVLRPGGRFVLNISDHIRNHRRIPVSRFHKLLCLQMGFQLVEQHDISTPRQRFGQNGQARVDTEQVFVFEVAT